MAKHFPPATEQNKPSTQTTNYYDKAHFCIHQIFECKFQLINIAFQPMMICQNWTQIRH